MTGLLNLKGASYKLVFPIRHSTTGRERNDCLPIIAITGHLESLMWVFGGGGQHSNDCSLCDQQ